MFLSDSVSLLSWGRAFQELLLNIGIPRVRCFPAAFFFWYNFPEFLRSRQGQVPDFNIRSNSFPFLCPHIQADPVFNKVTCKFCYSDTFSVLETYVIDFVILLLYCPSQSQALLLFYVVLVRGGGGLMHSVKSWNIPWTCRGPQASRF